MATGTATTATDWEQKQRQLMGQRDHRVLPPWIKLPALPNAVTQFVKKAQEPAAGADELGKVVEKDCGLTSLLLKNVNSSASGFQNKAKSAQEAIARLGIRASMLLLTTDQMNQFMKSSQSKVVNARGFFCSNLERALFARCLARRWGLDEELAFAGSMVSDCLVPVLTNQAADKYLQFLGFDEAAAVRMCRFEDKQFGWNHAEAAAYLFADWGFPPDLVCCVLVHHKGLEILKDASLRKTAAAAVAIAGLLPDQLRQEPQGLKLLQSLQQADPRFDIAELAALVDTEFREMEPSIENPFPLLRRVRRLS